MLGSTPPRTLHWGLYILQLYKQDTHDFAVYLGHFWPVIVPIHVREHLVPDCTHHENSGCTSLCVLPLVRSPALFWLCVCVCVCVCECVHMCTGTQLCLTRCDPRDYSPSGSSVHGIFQARILEWVAIPFRRSSQPSDWTHISYVSCTGRWILYQCTTWEAPDCCCYCKVTSVVSDSVRPHPWDSPGKNTGVGCHFLLQCIKVKSKSEVAQSSLTLRHPMDCSLPVSSVHGIFQARVLEWGAIAFSEAPDYQLPNATGDLGCLHICPSSLLLCSG